MITPTTPLSRLTDANYRSGGANQNWFDVSGLQYDRQGNILKLNRNDDEGMGIDQLTYDYNGSNQLQRVSDDYGETPDLDWDAEPASFEYDPNGNLTAKAGNSADTTHFSYDHRNLPLRITPPGGNSLRMRYSADGQRYLKQSSAEQTFYILDGDQTLAVMKDNTLSWWNITGQGIEGRRDAQSDSLRFYLKDHLGSTRAVVDNSGIVLETFDYYPFGLLMPKRNTAGANTMEKFTGHELDDEVGLNIYYMIARGFDPVLGRFMQPDPYAADYPNLSPYSYVANNPLLYTDPTGKYIVDSNGNRVEVTTTQDEDGNYINSYTFAEGTEQSVIDDFHANGGTILNAMALTEEGRTQLGNLVDAEHSIGLNLSGETVSLENGGNRLGLTQIRGAILKSDGTIDLSNATTMINVYEGSINEMANLNYEGKWGDFASMGKTGMIGATGSHEAVHATSKQNMRLGASKSPDYEKAPNEATFRYVRQFLKKYK